MDYRAYLTVKSPRAQPAETWDTLHKALEREAGPYGPVPSYFPDRESDSFHVVMSTAARDPLEAAFTLTSVIYLALRVANLDDCHVSTTEIEEATESSAVAIG
jgi:hypothetical protein